MTITLRIDNFDQLPDGGPVQFQAHARGFDIGREGHLDWTLPDPNRVISGRHLEVRFEKGAYWMTDVSRNGTFLNGSQQRMKSPHRLESGDRLQIGHYLVSVSIDASDFVDMGDQGRQPAPSGGGGFDSIWDVGGAAPPVDRRAFMPEPKRGNRAPDFAEQYIDLPDMRPQAPAGDSPFGAAPPQQQRPAPAAPDPFRSRAPSFSESPFGEGQSAAPAAPPAMRPMPSAAPEGFAPPPRRQRSAPPQLSMHPSAYQNQPPQQPAPPAYPQQMPPPAYQQPPAPPAYQQPAPPPVYQQPMPPQQPAYQQAPQQPMPPMMPPQAPVSSPASPSGFVRAFAAGAGVSPEIFGQRNPDELAHEIGGVMRVMTEQLSQLLKARAAAKTMAKSSNRTVIGRENNNPLKFLPVADEAIDFMFARPRPGYLDARQAVQGAFDDLKSHEIATYAAIQKALFKLIEGLSPEAIESKVSSSAFSSKKAKAWEIFVERWEAKTEPHPNGMLDVFLLYFAEAYDEISRKR